MDDSDEQKRSRFPEGYEYIEDIIGQQIKVIRNVEKQISSLPNVRPAILKFEFNPRGMGKVTQLGNFAETRNYLERQLASLEKELDKRVAAETRNLDSDDVVKIKEAIVDLRNPNPFEGKTEQEMKYYKPFEKDLNNSQHFTKRLLENSRLKLAQSVEDKTNAQPQLIKKSEPDKKTKESPILVSLRYTQMRENLMKKNLESAKDMTAQPQRRLGGRDMDLG